jgi:hypothetical protein
MDSGLRRADAEVHPGILAGVYRRGFAMRRASVGEIRDATVGGFPGDDWASRTAKCNEVIDIVVKKEKEKEEEGREGRKEERKQGAAALSSSALVCSHVSCSVASVYFTCTGV